MLELEGGVGIHHTYVRAKTLTPAPRRRLVRRDRILSRLDDAPQGGVVLVHAPAGFGKSSVLAQWAETDAIRRFAWLELEHSDNDPVVYWTYVLAAIRALSPGSCERAWDHLRAPAPDLDEVVNEAINGFDALTGRIVLVLDDFQVISDERCVSLTQRLLDHLPDGLTVAIATRTSPPLRLSRLETHDRLLTIEATDLRFSRSDTRDAFERSARHVDEQELETIHRASEGWPVAVYLIALQAQRRPLEQALARSSRSIRSFVDEEIFAALSAEDRAVMTDWALARYVSGDLGNAIVDRTDSAARLRRLAEDNLLVIPVDEQDGWFRFHDLLRDALLNEFGALDSVHKSQAHRRAGEWFLDDEDHVRAIDHFLAAGDTRRAGELMCVGWFDLMIGGRVDTVKGWSGRMPSAAAEDFPPLLVAFAWIEAFAGDVARSRQFAMRARSATYGSDMPDGASSYDAALAIMRAGLGHDGLTDASSSAETALTLEAPGSPWRPMAAALAGVTRFGLGLFDEAEQALTESARSFDAPPGVSVYSRGQLALLGVFVNRMDMAAENASIACADIASGNLQNLMSSAAAFTAAAAVAARAGNVGLARQRLGSLAGLQHGLTHAIPFDALQINLFAAEAYLDIGDASAARVHIAAARRALEVFGDAGIFEEQLRRASNRLSEVQPDVGAGVSSESLSARELQILALLESDLSLREIGDELYVSRNTAKTHVANVYRKLGVTSRTAAVARGHELQLI